MWRGGSKRTPRGAIKATKKKEKEKAGNCGISNIETLDKRAGSIHYYRGGARRRQRRRRRRTLEG